MSNLSRLTSSLSIRASKLLMLHPESFNSVSELYSPGNKGNSCTNSLLEKSAYSTETGISDVEILSKLVLEIRTVLKEYQSLALSLMPSVVSKSMFSIYYKGNSCVGVVTMLLVDFFWVL